MLAGTSIKGGTSHDQARILNNLGDSTKSLRRCQLCRRFWVTAHHPPTSSFSWPVQTEGRTKAEDVVSLSRDRRAVLMIRGVSIDGYLRTGNSLETAVPMQGYRLGRDTQSPLCPAFPPFLIFFSFSVSSYIRPICLFSASSAWYYEAKCHG